MAGSRRISYVAHVEDADDDSGESVEGIPSTRKYAMSEAPVSPVKERPNTSKSRSERRPVQRRAPSSTGTNDSDSTARSEKKQKEASRRQSQREVDRALLEEQERERRRRHRQRDKRAEEEEKKAMAVAKAQRDAAVKKQQRPNPLRHAATQPEIMQGAYRRGHVEDPSYYGVQQAAAPASRPRASERPASYYAGQASHPPITNMGWHQTRPQGPPPFPVGTFPPPMFSPSPGSMAAPSPSSNGSQGYFDAVMGSNYHHNLKQRFDTRPSSAMGFQSPSIRGLQHDEYEEDQVARIPRRASRTKRHDDDRKKMPPPTFIPKRPQSALPQSSPFAPPPPPHPSQMFQRPPSRHAQSRQTPMAHRRSVGFTEQPGYDDDDLDGDEALFHDISPEPAYDARRKALSRTRHLSGSYEPSEYELSPSGHRSRQVSAYNPDGGAPLGILGASYEDNKFHEALRYQEDVAGGPTLPLTAETLRNAASRGGVASSRSTRSSGSRDDSDYKRSNTTGITRVSSDNNDDVIIKVSGAALVRVQGAEIECSDGEIMFSSRPAGMRSGSDMASTVFQIEDGRSRPERKALPHRPRAPSQSDSQSRGYAPSHAPYEPMFDNYY
ncbi:hypothetical protein S40285_00005 [Stachybotrys chlorohalonatus IBT 40285]|uniref:Uncharacterized protein n=1 Tax=Stachybotrys chlorohalonatus (strain IBT 40285) TaxID=1283841 RepID=A0A084QYX6_STAC4|nr:hypothetical protein S40285_00005 [Stachybotrys chlorohalonata IBT 40285]